jgi:hypothetical protein
MQDTNAHEIKVIIITKIKRSFMCSQSYLLALGLLPLPSFEVRTCSLLPRLTSVILMPKSFEELWLQVCLAFSLPLPLPLPIHPSVNRFSLCTPGCLRTYHVDQAGLALTDILLPLPPKLWD